MTDRSVSGVRKYKWTSPVEVSPSKYLRGNESKVPRREQYSRELDPESPNPPQDRHVTLYSESTPKRSPDLRVVVKSRTRVRPRGHLRAHSLDLHRPAREEALAADTPKLSVSLGEGDHQLQIAEEPITCCQDPRTPHGRDRPRSKTQNLLASSRLFKKAFSDILGVPGKGRRSLDSQIESLKESKEREKTSQLHLQESNSPKAPPTLSSPEREIVQPKPSPRTEEANDAGGPTRYRQPVTQARPEEGPVKSTRYVFLGESDKESDTEDYPKKDPSIGSDFSDVEDVSTLARFSQEDLPSPVSVQDDRSVTPSSSSGYVVYPRHLYESPWNRSKGLWPISTFSPVYKPSVEQNTWRQDAHNSSCASEVFSNLECSHDVSSDSDYAIDKSPLISGRERRGSLDLPWTFNRTTKNLRKELEAAADCNTPKFLEDSFIDTHCHLDFLFARLQYKRSFADFREQYTTTFPAQFQGCVADYCDPRTLQRLPWQQVLNEELVWGAFGCHPHFAQYYNNALEEEMMQALRHPKVIAFGEMGLDYSHKCSTKILDQHAVFEKQLKLAVSLGKPLVIHCRDADEDLFRIMKKWVPRDYKIHRHCFTGCYEEIEPFLTEFPNMAVGFTAVLTYPSAEKARDAVTRIPLDRLIVETDAPFFVPRQVPKSVCKFSHPGLALHTVQEIARLKNLPIKPVMAKLRENTHRLYNI